MDTILYLGGGSGSSDPLGAGEAPGARRLDDGSITFARLGDPPWKRDRRLVVLSDAVAAGEFARANAVDVLVVDTRDAPRGVAFESTPACALLRAVFPDQELYGALAHDHVLGVVSPGAEGIDAAYHLGRYQIGAVLVAPDKATLAARVDALVQKRRVGRIAVCLAGGGIEGLFYEIGVLRALDAFLEDRPIVDLDLFLGISAGAVLGAFLANGVGPDEIARAMQGQSARLDPVGRRAIFDPNLREISARIGGLLRGLTRRGPSARGTMSSLIRAVPSAAFAGDELERWLLRQLTRPGMTNSFEQLRRPLYIGATDQDTSEAMIFGAPGTEHVPVHKAARASAALIPFYAPVQIDGRWYIDGAFSRTTNMREAVDRGATLVIIVDPLVPVHSLEPGYVKKRGGVFGAMQGLKALINGRFGKAVRAMHEMFPDVAFHLFRPEGDEMRMLSGSPMKYFYRREVEEVAYERTLDKIRASLPSLTRDFARHGVTFRDPLRAREPAGNERFDPEDLGVGL